MKYNPMKPLTEEELKSLSESEFFEYLDSKTEYLSQFAEPLDTYHTKRYFALTKGETLTNEELRSAKKKGRIGHEHRANRIMEAAKKMKRPKIDYKIKKPGDGWID